VLRGSEGLRRTAGGKRCREAVWLRAFCWFMCPVRVVIALNLKLRRLDVCFALPRVSWLH